MLSILGIGTMVSGERCLLNMGEYKILAAGGIEKLSDDINKMLSQGWVLVGGVSVGEWEDGSTFAQAIIKSDNSDEN